MRLPDGADFICYFLRCRRHDLPLYAFFLSAYAALPRFRLAACRHLTMRVRGCLRADAFMRQLLSATPPLFIARSACCQRADVAAMPARC